MFRVLLTDALDHEAEARLAASAVVVRPVAADDASLRAAIADVDAVIARTSTPLTRAVLESGRRLRVVGVAGVGLDRVDLEAAAELGVRIVHRPDAASDAVAELTVALMLNLLRPIRGLCDEYRAGRFAEARATAHGVELRGRTVGVIGMGRIGSRVARIASAGFGADVLYHDIRDVGPFPFAARRADAPTLWRTCNVITLHVPLTSLTRGMVDAATLAMARSDALLINTARGAVIHTASLVDALRQRRIGGAALDVTDPEPLPKDHPLLSLDRCIVTPHVAARTQGGLRRMYDVVDDVLAALAAARG